MYLIKLEQGAPVGSAITLENFKQVNPDLSLPFPLLPEHIEPHGYGIYDFTMPPECGPFEKLEEVAPVRSTENGVYYQTRIVVPMSKEECVEAIRVQWIKVRDDRGYRLMICDWTQLHDTQLSTDKVAEWSAYRQALRDITEQEDPFNITWPVPPS